MSEDVPTNGFTSIGASKERVGSGVALDLVGLGGKGVFISRRRNRDYSGGGEKVLPSKRKR